MDTRNSDQSVASRPDPTSTYQVYGGQQASSSGLPSVEQVMVAVYSHRYLVLGLLVGALLMGLLVTFMTAPQYTSTARIEILRSEEHTSELQSLMRISYAVFCLKKNITNNI